MQLRAIWRKEGPEEAPNAIELPRQLARRASKRGD